MCFAKKHCFVLSGNNDIGFTTSKDVILDNLSQDIRLHDNNNRNNANRQDSESDSVISIDPDQISIATDSSSSSHLHSKAWGPERLIGVKKEQSTYFDNFVFLCIFCRTTVTFLSAQRPRLSKCITSYLCIRCLYGFLV